MHTSCVTFPCFDLPVLLLLQTVLKAPGYALADGRFTPRESSRQCAASVISILLLKSLEREEIHAYSKEPPSPRR